MIDAHRKVLDSGLTLVAVRRPYLHAASMGAFVRVGTRYERREEQGLAHFLEHLLFRGSDRLADSIDLSREVERLGGYMDAWVHQEMTTYIVDVHRDHWRQGLELLGEVLLHPTFTDRQVELEKAILVEEMGQYTDSRGDSVNLYELVYQLLWGDDLAQVDMGNLRRNLARFDRAAVLEFYRTYYTSGNTVIVVVGDLDPAEALTSAERLFGKIPVGRAGAFKPAPPGGERPASVFRYLDTTQIDANLALRSHSIRHPDYPAASVLAEVLGGGTGSRLFSRVREEKALVYDIRSETATFHDAGAITISTYCSEQNIERTLVAILDVLRDVYEEGISVEELERARALVRASADYLLDSAFDLADWYGRVVLLDEPGDLPDPRQETEKFTRVAMEDMNRVIAEILKPTNRYLAVLGPVRQRQKRRLEAIFREKTLPVTAPRSTAAQMPVAARRPRGGRSRPRGGES